MAITNLNTITATLQQELDYWSWSGHRYVDATAWPQDFKEQCSTTYDPVVTTTSTAIRPLWLYLLAETGGERAG